MLCALGNHELSGHRRLIRALAQARARYLGALRVGDVHVLGALLATVVVFSWAVPLGKMTIGSYEQDIDMKRSAYRNDPEQPNNRP